MTTQQQDQDPADDHAGTPTTPTQPAPPHTDRTGIGSLAGQLTLDNQWDSPETNHHIANDFND